MVVHHDTDTWPLFVDSLKLRRIGLPRYRPVGWALTVGPVILVVVMISIFACGLVIMTSGSRLVYSMSRDRRFPGHQVFGRISPTLHTPVWACIAAIRVVMEVAEVNNIDPHPAKHRHPRRLNVRSPAVAHHLIQLQVKVAAKQVDDAATGQARASNKCSIVAGMKRVRAA